MLCLCPNHHDQFDAMGFYIEPYTKAIVGLAEFEGKMPCELCQDVVKDWYSKWHRQHYPYFDRNIPYEGWG